MPDLRIVYLASARVPSEKASALQIAHTCAGLAASGAQVHLVTRRVPEPSDPFAYYGLKDRFELHRLATSDSPRWFGPTYRLTLALKLLSLRWRLGPLGTIYTREPGVVRMLAPLRGPLGARLALEIQELVGPEIDPAETPERRRLAKAFAAADAIVVGTARLRDDMAKVYGLPPGKIAVVPDGFAPAQPPAKARETVALKLGGEFVRDDVLLVAYTGQMFPWKGADLLVEALAHVNGPVPLRLAMVGGLPEDLERLKKLAERLGVADRVRFTGHVLPGEVPVFQAAADLLALPTPDTQAGQYACPIKIFEYMASGRPMVATSVAPHREILTDGVDAFLAEPDPKAFAQALARAAREREPAARVARTARERALKEFTWRRRGERLLAHLKGGAA